MSPSAFNDNLAGEARAILAKAEVVARDAGVAYDSLVRDERPAARGDPRRRRSARLRPDLHGLARPSRRQGPDARLADAESAAAHDHSGAGVGGGEQCRRARRRRRRSTIIRDEHRSLAAVIHGLEYLVRDARDSAKPPSFPLLRAMLHYINAFPEKLHHPKEDAYLFRKLRRARRSSTTTLDELERQHVGRARARRRARSEPSPATRPIRPAGSPAFAAAVERFASAQMAAHERSKRR